MFDAEKEARRRRIGAISPYLTIFAERRGGDPRPGATAVRRVEVHARAPIPGANRRTECGVSTPTHFAVGPKTLRIAQGEGRPRQRSCAGRSGCSPMAAHRRAYAHQGNHFRRSTGNLLPTTVPIPSFGESVYHRAAPPERKTDDRQRLRRGRARCCCCSANGLHCTSSRPRGPTRRNWPWGRPPAPVENLDLNPGGLGRAGFLRPVRGGEFGNKRLARSAPTPGRAPCASRPPCCGVCRHERRLRHRSRAGVFPLRLLARSMFGPLTRQRFEGFNATSCSRTSPGP